MSEPPCPTKVKLRYAITGPSAGDPPAWTVVDLVFGPVLHASKKECEDFIAAQDAETWTHWFEDTPFGRVRWQVDEAPGAMPSADYVRDLAKRDPGP